MPRCILFAFSLLVLFSSCKSAEEKEIERVVGSRIGSEVVLPEGLLYRSLADSVCTAPDARAAGDCVHQRRMQCLFQGFFPVEGDGRGLGRRGSRSDRLLREDVFVRYVGMAFASEGV